VYVWRNVLVLQRLAASGEDNFLPLDFPARSVVLWGMGLAGWRLAAMTAAAWFLGQASGASGAEHRVLHVMISLGLFGVLLVSIVDSSFVPLPLPGVTDIMVILFAAEHANVWLLVGAATLGSALGGLFSYQVGQSGGLAFIEKRTPKRIFKQVTGWMESHAVLAVSVPALLPPPMPLSPFVLAAGALKMSRRKFMWAFTMSRLVRHALAAWAGVHYGKAVLVLWNKFILRWGTPVLVVIWGAILISVGFAFWQLWKQSRSVKTATA
jgi:membrane protein YqaA with SNARE-associated domain